jgi:replication-associated recombination protein RarA
MKTIIDRRAQTLALKNHTKNRLDAIDAERDALRAVARKQEVVDEARRYYAAARMQGVIRGFLSRLETVVRRSEYRAALRIQKILRGRQGKKRWLAQYWRSEAVVKTQSALEVGELSS